MADNISGLPASSRRWRTSGKRCTCLMAWTAALSDHPRQALLPALVFISFSLPLVLNTRCKAELNKTLAQMEGLLSALLSAVQQY